MKKGQMKSRLSNLIPMHFRSVTRFTGSPITHRQIDYWWQWRDRIFRHKTVTI